MYSLTIKDENQKKKEHNYATWPFDLFNIEIPLSRSAMQLNRTININKACYKNGENSFDIQGCIQCRHTLLMRISGEELKNKLYLISKYN